MQIRKILENNNLTIAKADKSKSRVIINRTDIEQNIDNFILENNIKELKKDLTTTYQKQTQLLIKKCTSVIDRNKQKYILNMKLEAPTLNAYCCIPVSMSPRQPLVPS